MGTPVGAKPGIPIAGREVNTCIIVVNHLSVSKKMERINSRRENGRVEIKEFKAQR